MELAPFMVEKTIHGTKALGRVSPAQQERECDPWSEAAVIA
jgi:hypothetical protein